MARFEIFYLKNINMKSVSIICIIFLGLSINGFAQISLPSIIEDNMVLQQNFEAPIWGWAKTGQIVNIKGSWNNISKKTTADEDGKWMLKLTTPQAGGPYFVTINQDTLHNIMIGEVWICSGQSNMQWELQQADESKVAIETSYNPDIRLFYVAREHSASPKNNCYGNWEECNPQSASTFSAVAYYFGKELNTALDIPIGLIHVSWGGSTAQAWINNNILQSTPEGQFYIEEYEEQIKNAKPGINPRDHKSPSGLYNAMLKPLIPFGISGAIWYQGEANTDEHYFYRNLKETMISNWRDEWNQGDFPFYFVQLAPFNYGKEYIGAALRDAQRKCLEIPNTGMAVTLDIGNPDDIHPTNKKDVGSRLALWALAKTYGNDELIFSGPLYSSMEIKENAIYIYFNNIGTGLISKGGELTHFTISGKDKIFYPAVAIIQNNSIVVSSEEVENPIAVRFAFKNGDEPNLFNKEGLPASTFRTDDWKIITETVSAESEYDFDNDSLTISLKSNSGTEIRYTLDGSTPTLLSEKYIKPFTVTNDAIIISKVFVDGNPSLFETENKIEMHLARGKIVDYKNKYENRYSAGGDFGLVDCITGSLNIRDGHWQGFSGNDLDVTIDLGKKEKVSQVKMNAINMVDSWIVLPKQMEVYISVDGQKFEKVAVVNHDILVTDKTHLIHEFNAQFKSVEIQYIKVVAINYGVLPEWHSGAGSNSWVFVDEINIK